MIMPKYSKQNWRAASLVYSIACGQKNINEQKAGNKSE